MRSWMMTALVLTCVVGSCILVGCGGGGGGSTGAFKMTVEFPPLRGEQIQPAVIYEDTNSITVDIQNQSTGENVVNRVILNRPTPDGGKVTTTINGIPAGTWNVVVQGFSEENAGGKRLSKVTDTVTIEIGQTATKTVIMVGYPFSITLAASVNPFLVDETTIITATPKDAAGATLLGSYEYEWSSSNTGIAQVKGTPGSGDNQEFEGVARGNCNLKANLVHVNPEPGQADVEGTIAVTVNPNIDEVIITPSTMNLASGAKDNATATAKYKGNEVTNINFTFASNKTSVATVSKTGDATCEVTAVAGGVATITASQPYTSSTGTLEVTCAEGNLDLIIQ